MGVRKLLARMLTAARVNVIADVLNCFASDLQTGKKRVGKAKVKNSAPDLQECKSKVKFSEACKSAAESVEAMKKGRELVDPYSPAPKKSRFQKKLEMAMMPRCRKHKAKVVRKEKFERPRSRVEALLCDYANDSRQFGVDCSTRFLPSIYDYSRPSGGEVLGRAIGSLAIAAVMDAGEAAYRLAVSASGWRKTVRNWHRIITPANDSNASSKMIQPLLNVEINSAPDLQAG